MKHRAQLFDVADRQQGYFTAKQAQECGISRSHFHRKLQSGEWIKIMRGIYRLAQYPVSERPDLVIWTLWSRDKQDRPQGVWSHETALAIYDLSDLMPAKMHMTVPKNFRKQIAPPKNLILHLADLSAQEIDIHQGYRVTKPLRTLIDLVKTNTLSKDQLEQAVREALEKGLVSSKEIAQIPELAKYKHAHDF